MNTESLGEKLCDGYRVIATISLNGYLVEPLHEDGQGVRLFFVTKGRSPGVPFMLFKRIVSMKISYIFDKIVSNVANYH